jgi:hypothetical protein
MSTDDDDKLACQKYIDFHQGFHCKNFIMVDLASKASFYPSDDTYQRRMVSFCRYFKDFIQQHTPLHRTMHSSNQRRFMHAVEGLLTVPHFLSTDWAPFGKTVTMQQPILLRMTDVVHWSRDATTLVIEWGVEPADTSALEETLVPYNERRNEADHLQSAYLLTYLRSVLAAC